MIPFVFGLAAGYFVGVLVAPASGKEMRSRIRHGVDTAARKQARKIGARTGEAAYESFKERFSS